MFEIFFLNIRSKAAVFYRRSSDEQTLLNNTRNINMKTFSNQQSIDSLSTIASINKNADLDIDDNDLHPELSKSNRINEWQAGWNVTNAIQVSNLEQCLTAIFILMNFRVCL